MVDRKAPYSSPRFIGSADSTFAFLRRQHLVVGAMLNTVISARVIVGVPFFVGFAPTIRRIAVGLLSFRRSSAPAYNISSADQTIRPNAVLGPSVFWKQVERLFFPAPQAELDLHRVQVGTFSVVNLLYPAYRTFVVALFPFRRSAHLARLDREAPFAVRGEPTGRLFVGAEVRDWFDFKALGANLLSVFDRCLASTHLKPLSMVMNAGYQRFYCVSTLSLRGGNAPMQGAL